MRPLSIFLLFFIIEYSLRTFVELYKYHKVGILLEFLPLAIAALISGLIYQKAIVNGHFGRTFLKLVAISSGGLLIAKTLLFIQWYWLIAPEYRTVPGDMGQGFGWGVLFLGIGTIVISFTYLVEILVIKAFHIVVEGKI